ncbi:DNA translocase FtsK [Patescibacteria group bacterium]|nr:DNA translocase FtsK [Patescibacteria group bacterium]MBU1015542.1 DNA translocase FtsK [Patescibacteria group bacterium]MBU1685593.1 DNA translocase FtsK [Patescibacteria group bacterium]MBU1938989.1 DNA translocase FtsK [Patescibacteria group bacterium]
MVKKRKLGAARKTRRLPKEDFTIELDSNITREIGAVIYVGLAIISYLFMSGRAGILGEWMNTYLRLIFGVGTVLLPVIFLGLGITLFFARRVTLNATKYLGLTLMIFAGLGLVHMKTEVTAMLDNVEAYGGYVGFLTSVLLRLFISDLGAKVIMCSMFLIGALITFEISIRDMIRALIPNRQLKIETRVRKPQKLTPLLDKGSQELNIVKPLLAKKEDEISASNKAEDKIFKEIEINKPGRIQKKEETVIKKDEIDYSGWELPPLDLLSSASSEVYVSDKVLKDNAERIREKLLQFGIEVTMQDVNIGPTVLQYTLKPSEGIKLTKITTLKDDLALALAAKSIRMEAPIPGKSLVGIEVPNEKRMVVHLREMLESEEFASMPSKLRLAIGRDVSGMPVIDDLETMPHLLIAGATGSGKSVGMNTFLLSLLYQNSPRDLKFIMVDPKRVELTPYNGIPHLLTPVITDSEKAHSSLKWACAEMNRRYLEFAEKGYKNIKEYNAGESKPLHRIVIVIDELADLMMQASKKETEALICRIAQMARAVGMHLIIATQRPSVDVITGVIKANIPTRIAFTVTSGVDSRTIIDGIGAEDLLGMGDMLYLPGNMSRAIRVQGVYVSTKEIEKVTNRIKLTVEPAYDESITKTTETEVVDTGMVGSGGDGTDQDSLYNDALDLIRDTGKASASLLQRRLSVGYARAARILDILEEHGMIGPANGAKPRDIYINKD